MSLEDRTDTYRAGVYRPCQVARDRFRRTTTSRRVTPPGRKIPGLVAHPVLLAAPSLFRQKGTG